VRLEPDTDASGYRPIVLARLEEDELTFSPSWSRSFPRLIGQR